MPRYAAMLLNSKGETAARITSVIADDIEEATAELKRQLSQPGRRGLLKMWQEDGYLVEEVKPQWKEVRQR